MNKNDICINVAKCTPEQRKEIVIILEGAGERIYEDDFHELIEGKSDPIYNFLVWDDEEGFWMGYSDNDSRKILTFPEFKAFFQGEQANAMQIKIKRLHPDAVIPSYAKPGDAGMDLTVTEWEKADTEHVRYKFGIAMEIPTGHVGLIFPRSSVYKQGQLLSNSVGVCDSGYRGEIMAVLKGTNPDTMYKKGDRAAQIIIMPFPAVQFVEVDELSETERGIGGYGSTGK